MEPRTLDPASIRSILATDCGSTTTKAILIERRGDAYRLIVRGEAPTTVEAPFEDVTRGVLNAVREVEELAGRKILDGEHIISPQTGDQGVDLYVSTSSAGGGLQMMVSGLVLQMTGESAQRAALGAGAIVMDVIALNDGRRPHEKIRRLRQLRPDMILLSGGTDGGDVRRVAEMAEMILAADPKARLGAGYQLPVIYGGNQDATDVVRATLGSATALSTVPNLRPSMERENLGPARDAIHELFMEHVMAHAPGYKKLMTWSPVPIMPTPGAVGIIIEAIAKRDQLAVVGVDIGGATTDVFSVFQGVFNRTVSANLGMSYSISNVMAEAGIANILRWVPFAVDEVDLRNRIKNKMIRPTTIPQTLEDLVIEQAIAREALRLAFEQHKALAVGLKGVQSARTISDIMSQTETGATLVSLLDLGLLVGSGGVLSHAPRRVQSALMMVDAFLPEGLTHLAVDSIFMAPQLGVLSTVHEQAATEVFERDCLVRLGAVLAPMGAAKAGQPCVTVELVAPGGGAPITRSVPFGELALLPLPEQGAVRIKAQPERGFDLGAGKGKPLEAEVLGGVVGLIVDARGRRPFALPDDAAARIERLRAWNRALNLYAREVMAHAYTPGLRITDRAVIRRERRLPLKGDVLVTLGQAVAAETIVARTELPGNVQTVNLAAKLSIDPAKVPDSLKVPIGSATRSGDVIAEGSSLFGLVKQRATAPADGTIESVSPVTGQLILREPPIPVEVNAYVRGVVAEVLSGEGVVVEAEGALMQGIFGIGGETSGPIRMVATAPDQELPAAALSAAHAGCVVIGGSYVSHATIMRARELGIAAVVVGGFDDRDLRQLLGRDLGVAITGSEDSGLTLILTEGFGKIRMAERTWKLLGAHEGQQASVSGATQIRAGVMRPEIVIPRDAAPARTHRAEAAASGMELGSLLRVIREPHFGRIARVVELPAELQPLETEALVRVMAVEFADDRSRAVVPRANVELIED